MRVYPVAALVLAVVSVPAAAAPGLGEKVYGATVEKGVFEVEVRYGRLAGDQADGEDGAVVELSHGFSDRFYGGVLLEFEREAGQRRRLESVGLEGIIAVGRIKAIDTDVAVYGEYDGVREGADKVETKLLFEHRKGSFEGRFNLVAEKELKRGSPVELGYAASADWKLVGDLRGGIEGFGELGSTRRLLPRAEHFVGPMVKTELEHLPGSGELEIEAGYLFALGAARDETNGQARLLLEYEFRF
jgi:hypothetical protein